MFEVGKYYSITTVNDSHTVRKTVRVLDWSCPLLKYDNHGAIIIFNTSSPLFFEAEQTASPSQIAEAERMYVLDLTDDEHQSSVSKTEKDEAPF